MKSLWLILGLALLPGVALAKPVTVRSGEHAEFSRLVIYYGAKSDWTFKKIDGGYELRPTKTDTTYDLAQVFTFIPRDRIAEVTPRSDGSLYLKVDCNCHAEVSEHLRQVVVDVKDGASDKQEVITGGPIPKIDSANNAPGVGDTTGPRLAGLTGSAQAPFGPQNPYRPDGSRMTWTGLDQLSPLSPPSSFPRPSMEQGSETPDPRVAETQASLVAQIARAATEGLVTPNLTTPSQMPPESESIDASPAGMSPNAAPDGPSRIVGPNIRIETAFERGELSIRTPIERNSDGISCLSPSMFELAAWGKPPDDGAAIAEYRANLVGEFDAANQAGLLSLAKHYIYLTFGAEAKSLIRTFNDQPNGVRHLIMLADIMDNGHSNAFPEIADQISCKSASAMWAIMADPVLTQSKDVSRPAVLLAFTALPLHLRRHIGPGLADRFLQINDAESAATIQNSIIRAPGAISDDVKLMGAGIALHLGEQQVGLAQLEEVIDDSGPMAPTAIIALIIAKLDSGDPVDTKLIETARAMAFEARGVPIGAQLTIVSLRAMAHQGNIAAALDEFDGAIEPFAISDRAADGFRQEAIDLASRIDEDAQFLRVVYRGPLPFGPGQATAKIRQKVAQRLVTLGFHQAARDALGEDRGVLSPEDRLIYAQSLIGEERPDLAIGYLAGLKTDDAIRARANAHALAQDFDQAGALYADLGQEEDRARSVWRGQNLAAVREIGSEAERAAAGLSAVVNSIVPDGPIAPITLAESADILEQSREARQVLATLLDETARP